MDFGLTNRRAIVAAGSAGLGLGGARALAAEGARVAICGRDPGKLAASGFAHTFTTDLTDPYAAAQFVRDAMAALGGVDVLIANAGGPPAGTFADTDLDAYQHAFDLNCRATIAMCQVAIPAMRAQRFGRVVAITSVGAMQPIGTLMASSVARAAVTSFLKVTAREVAADGVTVNNLCPGFHTTDRINALHDDVGLDRLAASIPAKALGDPDDFGRVAAFLCSDAAKYITGTSIQVDGGAYAGLL